MGRKAQRRLGESSTSVEATFAMLAMAYRNMPFEPNCPGPLLVHESDGVFECHGPGCPGGLKVFHAPEVVHLCDHAAHFGVTPWRPCPVCSAASAAAFHGRP
jgi:hypothetical protein